MSEGAFFQDLAMLMAAAGVVAVVFARLKWPKVLGYILAGVFLGEHTWGGSLLADAQSVNTVGQLGVVFLMFSMGLEFSARDMHKMKSVTIPVAALDTVVMTWLGYTVGTRVFGWSPVQSLFLGAAICDSATTMLAKVVDEMHWRGRPFARLTLGSSVCEDVITVGVIALVTGFAAGDGLSFSAAATSIGGLLVFFLSVIVFGFVLVPRLLASVAKRGDDESLLLSVLGCCFLVSYVAYRFQFSLALGAFLVGVLGASSDVRLRIAALSAPLRSMFAAVFFVSIGLLVDPAACLSHAGAIAFLSALVMVGKFANCAAGALLAGESVKTAVQIGMSLAQIGEFAFMVALLYVACTGDSHSSMFQIVVAVSLATTLLNPFMIRWSEPVGEWAESHVPAKVAAWIEDYRGLVAKLKTVSAASGERRTLDRALLALGVVCALLFAVFTACGLLSLYDYTRFSGFFERHDSSFFLFLANLFAISTAPLAAKLAKTAGDAVARMLVGREDAKWADSVRNGISLIVTVALIVLLFAEVLMLNINLQSADVWVRCAMIVVLFGVGAFGWRFFSNAGRQAVARFNEAMTADERREKLAKMMTLSLPEGTLHKLSLSMGSVAIGSNVVSLNIRAKTGASVVAVERKGAVIRNIGPDVDFRVGDTLVALGEPRQIAALKDLLGITS